MSRFDAWFLRGAVITVGVGSAVLIIRDKGFSASAVIPVALIVIVLVGYVVVSLLIKAES